MPRLSRRRRSRSLVAAGFSLVAAVISGCLAQPRPELSDVQVTLAITSVPADVACVRITAAGPGRTAVREVDVAPGAMVNEPFSGLPLGTVVFKGEAFAGRCDAVTKATIPGWVSDPVTVSIVLGRSVTVDLTLNRNGRAKVVVDFSDEPACSGTAAACLTSSECCSKSCVRGSCQGVDGGTSDGATNAAGADGSPPKDPVSASN